MPNTPPLLDLHTYRLSAVSDNRLWGYHKQWPIPVGGFEVMEGPWNERRFLNALLGPNGEKVHYSRAGSITMEQLQNSQRKDVVLDHYIFWWKEAPGPLDYISLYFNMYEYGALTAPMGLLYRTEPLPDAHLEPPTDHQSWKNRDEWGFAPDLDDF